MPSAASRIPRRFWPQRGRTGLLACHGAGRSRCFPNTPGIHSPHVIIVAYETNDAVIVPFACRLRAGAAGGSATRKTVARAQESETPEARAPDGDHAGVPGGAGRSLRLLPCARRLRHPERL